MLVHDDHQVFKLAGEVILALDFSGLGCDDLSLSGVDVVGVTTSLIRKVEEDLLMVVIEVLDWDDKLHIIIQDFFSFVTRLGQVGEANMFLVLLFCLILLALIN